jgi:prophage regulatory protein
MHITNTILRLPAVLKASGVSRSLIYQQISEGMWPKPIRISNRSVGWLETEVQALINARVANFDSPAIRRLVCELSLKRTQVSTLNLHRDKHDV